MASPSQHMVALPYTVRNTFIDWAPPEAQDEGVFSTWHHPERELHEHSEGLPAANILLGSQSPYAFVAAPASSRTRLAHSDAHVGLRGGPVGHEGALPEREEGEIPSEGGELEDGELPECEEEDAPEVSCAQDSPPLTLQPSVGSTGHTKGACRPCAWIHKSVEGCRNGASCEYCHSCPPGEIKRRKQDKLLRRYIQSRHRSEVDLASPSSNTCASSSAETGSPIARRCHAQEMEPRYIELPGLLAERPPPALLGSAGHAQGLCKPCAWFHKDGGGCKNGASCGYCHVCPPGELKRRKRDKWEAQQRAAAETLSQACATPAAGWSPSSG
mmetsp:Transcript_12896/g.37157  ORF Transcript_12896/g.37157 Transcript_12896/m.37157 type:complete len:329 (+) Transcript_12896:70-1056(+)